MAGVGAGGGAGVTLGLVAGTGAEVIVVEGAVRVGEGGVRGTVGLAVRLVVGRNSAVGEGEGLGGVRTVAVGAGAGADMGVEVEVEAGAVLGAWVSFSGGAVEEGGASGLV